MLCASVEGIDGLEVSLVDVERGGSTYSADTLREVAASFPEAELFLVVGADVANELDTWVRVDEMKPVATLALVTRPGTRVDEAGLRASGWNVASVEIPALDISSSMIRERVASGKPVEFLVPDAAIHLIRERDLYPHDR
jgi:nicotinate-nucleotide adenylyltransferase